MAALFVEDIVVDEGDGFVTIIVRLTEASAQAVTVKYTTANGTANGTSSVDYTAASDTLTFLAGQTKKEVQVNLTNDLTAEGLEHFRFTLSAPVGATLAQASAMVSIVDNDRVVADTPSLFVRDVVVDEQAGTASFVVLLGGPRGQAHSDTVAVTYATSNATATAGSDYVAKSGTLTFLKDETVKTVVVDLINDATAEVQERFNLNLSTASGATILDGQGVAVIGANAEAAGAVAKPRISVSDMVVSEADGYVDIVVSLSAPGQGAVSVAYATANGTANGTSSVDYTAAGGTLNFAVGETTKVVRVELTNDSTTTAEKLEHFRFTLSAPSANATLAQASAMVSIVDNDRVVATPSLFVRDVVVDEKAGTASFVVLLGGPSSQASNSKVTVNYATANATATAGSDYTAITNGTLTFAAGETVKTVVVDLTDDTVPEGLERFNLNLSTPIGATIVDGQGVAVIGANAEAAGAVAKPRISVSDMVVSEADGYVDIVVSLSAPGQGAVSVAYATANGTANGTSSVDYTAAGGTLNFAVGETTKVVRVELTNDSTTTAEKLEHFRFTLSAPSANATLAQASAMVSIVDNDRVVATPSLFVRDVVVDEKAGTASFVVLLGGPSSQASNSKVTVNYATGNSTSNATATAGSDYTAITNGTLTFAAGETVQTVVVDLTDDTVPEGLERFNLNLSTPIGATIVDGQGVAVIGANAEAAGAVAKPRISVSDMVVSEADGYVDIVVSLSAPGQGAVSVAYATANGTANGTSSVDYTAAGGTLNFAVGETTKVVRVELTNDSTTTAEKLEHFRFTLSAPSANATLAQASAMVSIVDNDRVVATPSLFVRDVVVDEKAGTASFVVLLGGPSSQASNSKVTVNYATANATATAGSDYTAITNGTLTFAAGETVQTVVVDLTDDTVPEGLERFNLNLSTPIGATIVDGRGVAVIGASDAVAVLAPVISVANMVVSEADGYVDIVVSLSAPGQGAVSVAYATANGTANGTSSVDYTAAGGTLNFAVGETTKVVRVELTEDASVEASETFRLNLSGAIGASLANTFATITIVDNDPASINVYSYGISDDIYTVTVSTDKIIENPGGGNDLVNALVDYTLPANVENLTLTGAAAINGTGNALNNVLTGNSAANTLTGEAGNDTLNGGGGSDTLRGGVGNDTYVVGAGDTVVENLAAGTDTVQSALTYLLGTNVENLTLTGAAAINGTGNTLNNVLTGNSAANTLIGGAGNDTLNGGGGSDTLRGGVGNDIYVVGAGDTVVENPGEGTDTVQSALTYLLGTNVENLTLTGALAINGTGNTLNNVMTGNSAANTLTGGAGNDILNGGAGSDTLTGGTGNDELTGGTGFDHFVFAAGDSGNTVGNIDVITDYTRGPVSTGDEFDYGATALVIGGGVGAASATQASISATTGVATFAGGSGTTLADALADIAARFDAVGGTDPGEFAFFKVNNLGNFHLYISDTTTGVGTGDVVVQLQGITSILTIDTTAGDLTILTPVAPPVVLDLDGDGLEFLAMGHASNQALFDFNGDGTEETAAWVGPDDGFLVYDANGDRRVNDGSEIAFADMTAEADTDLEAVQAVFDSNHDGLLTATDEQFSRFGVWQDANGNGSTEGGEFKTLEEMAIVSLGMKSDGESYDTANGQVTVHGEASVTYHDGSQGLLGDVSLAIGGPADSSADSQVGGAGNDTLNGGTGNDRYQFNRGGGQDLVVDSGGNADRMAFSAGVNPFDLVLSRQANDLRIAVYGSADQVTVQNWYGGASNQVETIQAGNGQTLVSTQVNQLIDAMAAFTSNNNGMTWDQGIAAKPEDVQAVLAASWSS